jgi:hypothetical protein
MITYLKHLKILISKLDNIDEHLKQQEINRHKFIDVEKYQIEVFGKVKSMKGGK